MSEIPADLIAALARAGEGLKAARAALLSTRVAAREAQRAADTAEVLEQQAADEYRAAVESLSAAVLE